MDTQTSIGPVEEFEQWVNQYGDLLYRFAVVRIENTDVTQDLVQDTFLSAFKSQHSFRRKSSPQSWLIGILKHKIMDYHRSKGRTISLEETNFSCNEKDESFQPKARIKEWEPSCDHLIENEAFRETLQKCLGKLPENHKQLFLMRELDEIETRELCKLFNITSTNLWVMLHRIRNQLKNCLEKHWFK